MEFKRIFFKNGLTLIELLIVLGVVGIFLAGLTLCFLTIWRSWGYQLNRDDARGEVSFAMQRITRELRGLLNISVADSQTITFYFDLNDNGFQDANESITYNWSSPGTDLTRSGTAPLAHFVENFSLQYLDVNNNVLSTPVFDPSLIRRITINLTTKIGDESIALRTDIRPRNL